VDLILNNLIDYLKGNAMFEQNTVDDAMKQIYKLEEKLDLLAKFLEVEFVKIPPSSAEYTLEVKKDRHNK
jgi:hypothetical protein